ncbi:MAG: hypothetical protein CL827_06860 [Crocinitomicaceae bacterium]|nr:hypothetical protein [Crocinitomicaceae bacterium]
MKPLIEPRKTVVLVLIYLISTLTLAQSENNISNPKNENRKAQKIAFFNAKMNLNEEESKAFWPVVSDMQKELKDLKNKNNHYRTMLKNKKTEELSDSELEEIVDSRIQMGKDQMDIKIKYHQKFKEVLPIQKVAKYYQGVKEFKKIQSERKKQHNNPGERK